MADFTTALFLGHRHPSADLPPWDALTTGRPAAMSEPPGAVALARRLARRQGAEAGVVHRSAFHALWDVVDLTTTRGSALLLDRAAYPLSRWAASGAAWRGARVAFYRHHDPGSLARALRGTEGAMVITDGWCPDCGRPAPVRALADHAARHGGLLAVDDSLAAGILGAGPTRDLPFGRGGGGTVRWFGPPLRSVVQVSSLAKAYGAPLAVTTGPASLIHRLQAHGSRWHASPPGAADLAAALSATQDEVDNDRRRRRLSALVRLLRVGLATLGLRVTGRPFPMVSTGAADATVARALHDACRRAGGRTLLRQPRCRPGVVLTFVVCSTHRPSDVHRALDVVASALPPGAAGPAGEVGAA